MGLIFIKVFFNNICEKDIHDCIKKIEEYMRGVKHDLPDLKKKIKKILEEIENEI